MKRPRILPSPSIRSRLLLFLVLSVVVTAAAISVVTTALGYRDAHSRVIGQLNSVATLKESEIASWTSGLALNLDLVLSATDTPESLRALTEAPAESVSIAPAYENARERFLWAAERMGLFEEVFFTDVEGTVLISTDPGHEGQRLGLNDYFLRGLEGTYIEEPSYSLSLDKMTVVASAPVMVDGDLIGVIAGRADLDGLNEIMIERAGLGDTGETYLVGSNYRLLTNLRRPHYPIPETYVRTEGTEAAIGFSRDGSGIYQGYAGVSVVAVYRWVSELNVALVAEQEEGEALAPTKTALAIIGGVAVVAVLLAILAGTALTRRIVRPLSQLMITAGRITSGDLDVEAKVDQADEIGTLAEAFNRMTARLRHLVRRLERRTEHLRTINETGQQISAILDLRELLPYVAKSLLRAFDYHMVRILLLTDAEHGELLACKDHTAECTPVAVERSRGQFPPPLNEVAKTGAPVLAALEPTRLHAVPPDDSAEGDHYSEIAVPMRVKDKMVGVLDIVATNAHPLDEQDVFAARTIAGQLAIAIENSRLYEHADELAVSRERQRLARDLHDAVSQTLFSVSLIAEVLPRIYERDARLGQERLEELRTLTRGALAEMRTLLLELRPAALVEAQLPDLLRQLAEATTGRARIPVQVHADDSCSDLPTDLRVALYYITQEALNNVAKHSAASHATVTLTCQDQSVELEVRDDGIGFRRAEGGAGQLGLGIMQERAEAVGARLEMRSELGQGTQVLVTWHPGSARS